MTFTGTTRTRTRIRARTRTRTRQSQSAGAGDTALSNRLRIVERNPDELRAAPTRARRPKKGQRERMRANIERFDCVLPIPVTPYGEIIDGHGVWQACKDLGRSVPTIVVDGLSDAEVRSLRLSLNKLSELSEWDDEILKSELAFILDADPDLGQFTGFSAAEIDGRLFEPIIDDEEDLSPSGLPVLSKEGDLWLFGSSHRLLHGNARDPRCHEALMSGTRARALVSDIPYGCRIAGHASHSHEDFVDGAGFDRDEMEVLVTAYLNNAKPHLVDGALTYTFMDGRGLSALMTAALAVGQTQLALCIWDKVHPGMGSLYRQQGEFVQVCKFGDARHINNVALGRYRRNRSNVWSYPGLAAFGKARADALAMHPTVKPIGLIADIILDCTSRDDVVLDPFVGSGTIFLAAHRTKRVAYAMELDAKYIDVAIRRVERAIGVSARHAQTRQTYAETMQQRAELSRVHD